MNHDSLDSLKALRAAVKSEESYIKSTVTLICKIEGVSDIGDGKSSLQMRDLEGGLWHSEVYSKKFPHLKEGDVCAVMKAKAFYLKEGKQPEL